MDGPWDDFTDLSEAYHRFLSLEHTGNYLQAKAPQTNTNQFDDLKILPNTLPISQTQNTPYTGCKI